MKILNNSVHNMSRKIYLSFLGYFTNQTGSVCPPTHFKCENGLCAPCYMRCNTVTDCVGGEDEDEEDCQSHTCPGYYRQDS